MEFKPLVYLAGPVRGDRINIVYENIQRAREWACFLWEVGFAVFCPHLNTAFMDGIVEDEVFLEGDLNILSRCDTIFVLPGWEDSQGTIGEIGEALKMGIPIYFMEKWI